MWHIAALGHNRNRTYRYRNLFCFVLIHGEYDFDTIFFDLSSFNGLSIYTEDSCIYR